MSKEFNLPLAGASGKQNLVSVVVQCGDFRDSY